MNNQLSPQQITQYNAKHKENRDIDIFTGLCIGMLCDGHVNEQELNYLIKWIDEHPHVSKKYPVSLVAKKIPEWMSDGVFDEHEEVEMLNLVTAIANGSTDTDDLFCQPEPEIIFEGSKFAFTGKFTRARSELEKRVVSLGASIHKKEVSRNTNYLIVGETGSENWKHNGAGTKIIAAVELRDKGYDIKIVREQYFADLLMAHSEAVQ